MKNGSIFLFMLTLAFGTSAQRVPHKYRQYFRLCASGQLTSIRQKMSIDGYYTIPFVYTDPGGNRDTFFTRILFYEDGYSISGWGGLEAMSDQEYLKQVVRKGAGAEFYKTFLWGQYELRQDTIIVRSILPGTVIRKVSVQEDKYIIAAGNRLLRFASVNLVKGEQPYAERLFFPALFTPAAVIPSPAHSWLRVQKWRKCDR